MLRDVLSEAELRALFGDPGESPNGTSGSWDGDDRKLLHALVRNQLRLLHMIEEMQTELRLLKAAAGPLGRASRESAAGLEPLPLPFMKHSGAAGSADDFESDSDDAERQKAPAAESSRKERYKRKSFW